MTLLDWEQRKLGETLSKFDYGLNSASAKYDGKNKYLRITDIDEQTHNFNFTNLTSPKVDLKDKDEYILHSGDIVFARTGASVGKTYRYSKKDGCVYFAGFLIRGRINKGYDASFIFDTTLLPKYRNFVKVTSIRSGQPGINSTEYRKYSITLPSLIEQKKISKLITTLEKNITLQQRKLEQIKLLKKAMLQGMFIDENYPQIRFKYFTDAWERRKAKEIFKARSEKGFPHLPVLSATQDRGMIYREDSGIKIAYDKKKLSNYKKIEPGDFIVHLRSFQSGFAYSSIEGIVSPAYSVFTFKNHKNFDDYFWKEKFSNYNFIQMLKKVTYGVRDGKSISYSDYLTLFESYPTKEEQSKIGNFFSILNHYSVLQQNKINKLHNLKQFLLQNMFI